jgi:fructokinase
MNRPWTIVGIGETLWDCFPDANHLGGAPLNFCCSCSELGTDRANVQIVSAVGRDALGDEAKTRVAKHGVKTECIQSSEQATGRVVVQLDPAGVASYRFDEDSAWDHIEWSDFTCELASRTDAVCFGSLGQRSLGSRETIRRFVETVPSGSLRVLDVNLRPPYWTTEVILDSLKIANVLKLNEEELPIVAELVGLSGSVRSIVEQLMDRYRLEYVALTLGAKGSVLCSTTQWSEVSSPNIQVVDTVGAGDAFTAAMVLGLLDGWDLVRIHERAAKVASYVCTQPGATMAFPAKLRA